MDPFSDSIDEDNDESDLSDGFDIEEELEDQSVSNNGIQNPSQNKHLLELKETLGLESFKQQVNAKAAKRRRQKERKRLKKIMQAGNNHNVKSDFVETLASKMGKANDIIPEVVTFKDPRKRSVNKVSDKSNTNESDKSIEKIKDIDEISMKEARWDVYKFGTRGLDKKGQHDARVALAISLGAKPEKNKCMPYEQYKEQQRIEKENNKKELEMKKVAGLLKASKRSHKSLKKAGTSQSQIKSSKSQNTKSHKKSKRSSDSGGIQTKVGKFDGGMLKLSKKDIERIKGS